MTTRRIDFRILAAADGSTQARAALATLLEVPWPDRTMARAVVAKQGRAPIHRSILLSAIDRSAEDAAERARSILARRWPDADAVVVHKRPIPGILDEAERFRADVIVVGWRGHGPARRLLMGSVSRGIVRQAKCAVLVVRRRPARIRDIVIAFDGSTDARRAVALIARLTPPRNGSVTLVRVLEPIVPATPGRALASIRASISREAKRINNARSSEAMTALNHAAAELNRTGWRTRTKLRSGEPLRELIAAVNDARPQLLVVGARGTTGIRHLLLGSVAEGILNRSQVPVLVAR